MALKFLNTPFIEKRILGINMLISKVNTIDKSNFPCTWKRQRSSRIKEQWLTSDHFLSWLLDHKIFEFLFGETLHSELVPKYYAILSFLYSKDQLTEKHFDVMWDCAMNKHEAFRVNILKVLSTLALKILPSHAKFLYDKVRYMDPTDFCKFTLTLVKHVNKNMCKGPVSDQAAHNAGFGKDKRNDPYAAFDIGLELSKMTGDYMSNNNKRKGRSFSLGGDEKEETKQVKKRHNSPVAQLRKQGGESLGLTINTRGLAGSPRHKVSREADLLGLDDFDTGVNTREKKPDYDLLDDTPTPEPKKQGDRQSTDEEEEKVKTTAEKRDNRVTFDDESPNRSEGGVVTQVDDFKAIKNILEKQGQVGAKPTEMKRKEELEEIKREESKEEKQVELSNEEKEIKETLKEDTLDLLWRLCQESTVEHGLELSVHKDAIDAFAIALSYNNNETKGKYIFKLMERLQQNQSVLAVCSVLKKFLQQYPEGDIQKIKNAEPSEVDEFVFPKTRIELITKLNRDFSFMDELMSLSIEFKRANLGRIYEHLDRNSDREQILETQSSLSANDAEGEDTGEDEEIQTDAASQESNKLSENTNDEHDDNEGNDIMLKSAEKPQVLSEGDGFVIPKDRRISNNDEENKNEKLATNQSLSITDMTDEENKERDGDKKLVAIKDHILKAIEIDMCLKKHLLKL